MFLDETHVWPRKDEPPSRLPEFRHGRALSRIALVYAMLLLVLPFSLAGTADLIRYLFG